MAVISPRVGIPDPAKEELFVGKTGGMAGGGHEVRQVGWHIGGRRDVAITRDDQNVTCRFFLFVFFAHRVTSCFVWGCADYLPRVIKQMQGISTFSTSNHVSLLSSRFFTV